jgi:excinuclease ABC subunit C
MKRSLRMINKIFKIRSCKYYIDEEVIRKGKIKVCLDYHIKRCDGPCEGLISQEDYGKLVSQAIEVIRGKTDSIITELKSEMEEAAAKFQFEKAAELRDRIKQLDVYSSHQKIISTDFEDRDIITTAFEGRDAAFTVLNIRSGKLVGKRQFHLIIVGGETETEVITSILKFYYDEFVEVPREILLETEPSDKDVLLEWLNSKSERKVKFKIPQRASEAKSLLKMCKQNSILFLKEIQLQKMKKEGNLPYVLSALKRDLNLKTLPRKIECFDISNLQGTDSVASMVVFVDGKPKKSLYRKFIIESVEGPDDFASMREVFERRYSKLLEKNEPLPDLIMVDGGKGQLSAATGVLKHLGFKDFNIIGLAKRLEEIFKPGISEAQTIPKTSSSLKLLQNVRDEAHRFAITFHRQRRFKRTLITELTGIKGIGKATAEKLLKDFKSVKQVKLASAEELEKSVGKAKGKIVFRYFHGEG